jgi:lambda family phage portal protein
MFTRLGKLFGRKHAPAQRGYDAGGASRFTLDWIFSGLSANSEIKASLATIRARCREMERNDDVARGFFRLLENNVLGERGVTLQMKVKDPLGAMDELANDRIEWAWWRWGRPGVASVCGRLGWREIQGLVIRSLARDGEVLIRKHRGWPGSPYGFALEVLEADYLDESYDLDMGAGGAIRMGVEMDVYGRPRAYHILGAHPGEPASVARGRVRVPADEVLHLFVCERPGQVRGVPWLASSIYGLKLLRGYKEAELVAARAGASKLGFLERNGEGRPYEGDEEEDGQRSMKAESGTITELPAGMKFSSWDPNHPTQAFGDFVKAVTRGVASGLGVSYNSLSSDLEGVNYSSIRAGLLEEREGWKSLQRFLVDNFCEPVFEEWLRSSLALGAIPAVNGVLPATKFDKFNAPEFRGRRWPWVDPLKDIEAAKAAIGYGLSSRRKVIAEGGEDIYATFADLQADKDLAEKHGLVFDTGKTGDGGKARNGKDGDLPADD